MDRVWSVLALLCGCDYVFRLDHIDPDAARTQVLRYMAPGDYDGDGRPNDADPCPYLSFGDADDRDRDGVGDACDPNPDVPGDCFVLFDGFKDIIDDHWIADGTNGADHYDWSVCTDPGTPVFCSPRPANVSWIYFNGEIDKPTLVRTSANVWVASSQFTTTFGASLDIATAPNQVTARFCEVKRTSTGAVSMAVEAYEAGVPIDMASQPSILPFDNQHPFQLDWTGALCKATTSAAMDMIEPPPGATAGSYVGLRIDHGDLNLSWIAALRTNCP
jgi:hypothetical protein